MKDFHVHYHLDACGHEEMTMPNIERACIELDIDEAAVLKHYSQQLPNGKNDWAAWHVQGSAELDKFLDEYKAYQPKQVVFHSGVETELLNDDGDINIPLCDQEKVDIVQLSIHFMISTKKLPLDFLLYPNGAFSPEFDTAEGQKQWKEWLEKVHTVGAEYLIEATVSGYMNAIKRFPKVRSLAHMDNGLAHLYNYGADVDSVSISRRIEIFEPLMRLMHDRGVNWELTAGGMNKDVFKRARDLGVKFTCTADGHQLYEGWGPLAKHIDAENALNKLMNM